MVVNNMNDSSSRDQTSRFYEQLGDVVDKKTQSCEFRALDAMHNLRLLMT